MNSFIYKYDTGKNVIVTKYKDGCYMATSVFNHKDCEYVKPVTSFIYFNGKDRTAEWCPPYGPISVNTKAKEKDDNIRIDFFLGNVTSDWTQLGVDDNCMNDKALYDIDGLFDVLRIYAD